MHPPEGDTARRELDAMTVDLQTPFDVAVLMVTVVRPSLEQALVSVYEQVPDRRVQVVIGVDRYVGEPEFLQSLIARRPANVVVTLIDPGYSTSQRHGGLYPSHFGGSLKTALAYLANSRYVAYLDDDNWFAPDHLALLLDAVHDKEWAFALRHFVDKNSDELLCADTWESVGPGRGVYAEAQGGFVDTNCFLFDKMACHEVFPEWAMTRFAGGTGGDRQVLARLAGRPWGTSGAHTVFYRLDLADHHPYLLWHFRRAGVDLARYLPPERIPGDEVWAQCEAHDRAQGAKNEPRAKPALRFY